MLSVCKVVGENVSSPGGAGGRRQETPDRSERSEASRLGKEKADIWDLPAWLMLGKVPLKASARLLSQHYL